MIQKKADNNFHNSAYLVFKQHINKFTSESSFWVTFLNYSILHNQELEPIVMKIPDISHYDLKYLLYHSLLLLEEKESIVSMNDIYEKKGNDDNSNNNTNRSSSSYKEVEYKRTFNQSQKQHEVYIYIYIIFKLLI